MKVLYLHSSEINSGMANLIQVKSMCNAMVRHKFDVTLSLSGNKNELHIKNDMNFNLDVRKKNINSKIDKYFNTAAVRKSIKLNDPDIVYLRTPLLLKQAISSKKRIVIELHNSKLHGRFDWLNNYWIKMLIRLSKTDQIFKVVCISEALGDFWIKKGIPKEKLIVEHDGIDPKHFNEEISLRNARKQLNLPLNKKIITYAGRLYKNRKVENILELAKVFNSAYFVIVGGPEDQCNAYRRSAESAGLNNVNFIGQVPHSQVPLFLYASDILLGLWSSDVPTINYCSPLKVFEYMASGRIIVAHGFPTIKEVLKHNQNAILVEPDSLEDLINKVGKALEMEYPSSIALQARKDVFSNYTWDIRVDKIFSDII